MVCPHAAIRMKVYPPERPARARRRASSPSPSARASCPGTLLTIQVAPDDCTGCGVCVDVCPARSKEEVEAQGDRTWRRRRSTASASARASSSSSRFPSSIRRSSTRRQVKNAQTREPLFEFSGACAGCGETPYLKLLSQLFGDRLLVANATGCSSIYGGNLPTTPWTTNAAGRGPAWANSLFEDNAEFGLGMRLALERQAAEARRLLAELAPRVGEALARAILGESGPRRRGDRRASARASRSCARRLAALARSRARGASRASPTTSCARASGSSAATAGPTTSARRASTTCSPPAAT